MRSSARSPSASSAAAASARGRRSAASSDAAEAPAQLRELLQPLLDAVEHGGIGVQPGQVRAQLDRRLAQLLGDARQLVAGPGERGVVLAHAGQHVRGLARERDGTRALVGIEQLGGLLGGLAQDVEVAQAAALARQLILLAGPRVDLLHGLGERLQLGQASLLVGRPGLRLGERAPGRRRARARPSPSSLPAAREVVPARRIQQVELDGRAHEPARLVLRDHLDQRLADALEIVTRAAAAVEQRARAALAPHAAGDDDAFGALGRQLGQLLGQLGVRERRLDVGLGCRRADEGGVGATAEQQADGLGQDRLAGARLTRQHVEAGMQRQPRRAHEHEILDHELLEHQRVNASR